MAARKFSADDIKLDTENVEYAGDLKQVDSAHAADAATETIVVTEEDVSTAHGSAILFISSYYFAWSRRIDESGKLSTEISCPSSFGSTGCKFWTSHCSVMRQSLVSRLTP